MTQPHYLFNLTLDELAELVTQWNLPAFRAGQVMDWLYKHLIEKPRHMTNLSKSDRTILADRIITTRGNVAEHQVSSDGTHKLLLRWSDIPGDQSECVMIPANSDASRRTACLSSQIGCPVGCRFCASGLNGLAGNLSAGQMLEQLWHLNRRTQIHRISNVVFMGIGEPLANFDQLIHAVRIMNAPWSFNISARKITISTVGLPKQIRKLAGIDLPVTLAISLHAPNDELRRELIPWAQYLLIDEIIDAARYYFDQTGREITLEYILLDSVNDLPTHARLLVELTRKLRCNVNLIRYNPVPELPYQCPPDNRIQQFIDLLRRGGVNVHLRASRGNDISAACGQLKRNANLTT